MGALGQWRPFREMDRMNRLFDRMLDRMFGEHPWPAEFEEESGAYSAPVECFVQNRNLVVRADVPGMEPKDIDISLLGNVLTIKGERKGKEEVKKGDYLRRRFPMALSSGALRFPRAPRPTRSRRNSKTGSSR